MLTTLDMSEISEELITHVMSSDFAWYHEPSSTSPAFPYMSHTVLSRAGEIKSYLYEPMEKLVGVFCRVTNTPFTKLHRICFNQTVHFSAPHSDPHVDYTFPHKVLMFYPQTSDAATLVFEKKWDGAGNGKTCILLRDMQNEPQKSMNLLAKIPPTRGTAVCFDGAHYHANEFSKESERRVVAVVCFE